MRRLALFILSALPLVSSGERLTQDCKKSFVTGEVFLSTGAARSRVLALAADPASDPDLYQRLWAPGAIGPSMLSSSDAILTFDPLQDADEIVAAINADPALQSLGVGNAWANSLGICFSPGPPPTPVTITEYYNSIIGHYFLSSTDADNSFIDSGGAGSGWSRTGEVFHTIAPGYCDGAYPVFRFYTYAQNTHVFTMSPAECGSVRRTGAWIFEGESFGARFPVGGTCPEGTSPLYRLYNNRASFGDSNFRFATRAAVREQMKARGWIDEGLGMCLINYP